MRNVIVGCAVALHLTACTQAAKPQEQAPAFAVGPDRVTLHHATPLSFDVSQVKLGNSLPRPPVTARITTVEALTSPSYAPLNGRVVESRVHLGDRVRKGEKLVLVRTPELPTLNRERLSAGLEVDAKKAHVARLRALVEARAGSVNDLILAEHELEEAKVSLVAAGSRLSSLEVDRVDDTSYWVLARRDGTVVELNAAPGLEVGPSRGLPVLVVADLAEVLAVGDVPQRVAADLAPGMAATILAGHAEVTEARVESVAEIVDPERQTVPVRVRADNRLHKLRPNAYVELTFAQSRAQRTLLVPAASVVRDGSTAVVFVEDKPGSFVRRAVHLGQEGPAWVEVLSGLTDGERVVSSGALLLLNALDTRGES
ncbi:MAG: efflux RND transporter periplasmic adaptor subunit [Myxococcales bacterium]